MSKRVRDSLLLEDAAANDKSAGAPKDSKRIKVFPQKFSDPGEQVVISPLVLPSDGILSERPNETLARSLLYNTLDMSFKAESPVLRAISLPPPRILVDGSLRLSLEEEVDYMGANALPDKTID